MAETLSNRKPDNDHCCASKPGVKGKMTQREKIAYKKVTITKG